MNPRKRITAALALGAVLAAALFTTAPARSVGADRAARGPLRRVNALPVPARSFKELEVLTDRCSNSVWLSPDYQTEVSNPPGAIFLNSLDRSDKDEPDDAHPWSERMKVKRFGPGKLVRWFCGTTKERSRCPQGTSHLQGWLGPNRKLLIRCLKEV